MVFNFNFKKMTLGICQHVSGLKVYKGIANSNNQIDFNNKLPFRI